MYRTPYYDEDDPMAMYQRTMMARGGRPRRFDEYYRCYPVAMMPGPERDAANHGGKVFLPASALDKLTTLHITYPMLFELINGKVQVEDAEGNLKAKTSHSGVLEFIAEEGRCYLPYWLMTVLSLEPGDLLQVKSTDLPPGQFIKLQPQSPSFLDISDPKAVLENVFRSYSCLTQGDIFTFSYADSVYEIAVLEVKPNPTSHAISVQETDLEVDFAPPIGYKEPERTSGTSTPRSLAGLPHGGTMHAQGTMAQAINYASIAPSSDTAAKGAAHASSHFHTSGHRLVPKKNAKGTAASSATASPALGTPAQPSTPVAGQSTNAPAPARTTARRRNGPQPLRLPPNKLFFGYELKPKPAKKDGEGGDGGEGGEKPRFMGEGQSLRKKK